MNKGKFGNYIARCGLLLGLACTSLAWAETQVVTAAHAPAPGGAVVISLTTTGDTPQVSVFATENPARIVLDLANTDSSVDPAAVNVGAGAVRSYQTLAAGGRTRVLVDLSRTAEFDYSAEAGKVTLTIAGAAAAASSTATASSAATSAPAGDAPRVYTGDYAVENLDFRRGEAGQGRVIVQLDGEGASTAVNASSGRLNVDVFNATVPANLRQVLDVVDFATPVQLIDVAQGPESAKFTLTIAGQFEHLAYQSGKELIIEVTPVVQAAAAAVGEIELYEEKEYTGTRVTFNFQDIPVRSVLQLIADVSNLNIIVADNVTGNLTLRLTNVPWDQALDIILDARNLDMRENGNVIWIAPTSDIAAREQELLQAVQDRRQLEPLQTLMLNISYSNAEDLKKLIEEAAATGGGTGTDMGLLSDRGSVAVDARTNTLLVTDTADRLQAIQKLVSDLDRAVRQVQIESRIVIAASDFSHALGVSFGVNALHLGSNILAIGGDGSAADDINPATNPRDDGLLDIPGVPSRYNVNLPVADSSAGTFGLSFLTGNFLIDLELSALESEGEGEVISTPRVVTANQTEAFIQQGVEIPYEEATSSGATSVQFKEAVLELRVTPLITPDNRVQLDLAVKQDTVGEIFETARGGSVPSIDTRELETSVLVNNGETVVLGGIFQEDKVSSQDRIPYLSSIPGIGGLFKRSANETKKRELLIFVTPTIVEDRPPVVN